MPSDHSTSLRSACTLVCVLGAPFASGRPVGSKTFISSPSASRRRATSNVRSLLHDRSRNDP